MKNRSKGEKKKNENIAYLGEPFEKRRFVTGFVQTATFQLGLEVYNPKLGQLFPFHIGHYIRNEDRSRDRNDSDGDSAELTSTDRVRVRSRFTMRAFTLNSV